MSAEQTLQEQLRFWSDVERDTDPNSMLAKCIDTAADRIDELERQLAEAREDQADAKRYRWLRDLHWVEDEAKFRLSLADTPDSSQYEKELDQAIDAAIAQRKVKP